MTEQETEQVEKEQEPIEYTEEIEEIEKDQKVVVDAKDKFDHTAETRVTKLANILKAHKAADGTVMSDEEIADKIIHDCRQFWLPTTIRKAFPDWLKSPYEKEEIDEIEEEGVTEEGKEELEDPMKAMKAKITELSRTNASLKKSFDRGEEKLSKMVTELEKYKEQAKELKENTKLLDQVIDIYDKKLNALTFTVTGISITRLEEFATKTHSLGDEVELVLKFGTKGHVIDSIS